MLHFTCDLGVINKDLSNCVPMDDSKSDDTDELLTSIEPLLQQSEHFLNQHQSQSSKITQNNEVNRFQSNIPVIVDDILSFRSIASHENRDVPFYQSPSLTNIASHNLRQMDLGLESGRTVSSYLYEASISSQSTPRNMIFNKLTSAASDDLAISQSWKYNDHLEYSKTNNESQLQQQLEEGYSQLSQYRTEIQRLQLNNKQMETQLHESKLSIQALLIQLEQVQQESKHKENTLSNLDNTLGKLVTGWKKREGQKDQDLDNMKHQLEAKDKVIEECQRIAVESRKALSNADRAVQMEKNKVEQILKNAELELHNLKKEKATILLNNTELKSRCGSLETDVKKLTDVILEKIRIADVLNNQMKENYSAWKKDNDNCKEKIERLQKESQEMVFEIHTREEKLSELNHQVNVLKEELQICRSEKEERLKDVNELNNVLKKMKEEHILMVKKQEKDLASQWQQKLNKTVLGIQEQNKRAAQGQYDSYQAKLTDQSKKHRSELERLRHVAEQEIVSRMADSQETVSMLRERLERSEKSVKFWQQEKEVVEKVRNQISSQLWELMKVDQKEVTEKVGKSNELVKPVFVPPKNHNLQQTMPQSFFEPIKTDSTINLLSSVNTTRTNDYVNVSGRNPLLLSSSTASLYY